MTTSKKALLTLPALLVGPVVVLVVHLVGYDWSVFGAGLTAALVSLLAVSAVWKRRGPTP